MQAKKFGSSWAAIGCAAAALAMGVSAAAAQGRLVPVSHGFRLTQGADRLELTATAAGTLRLDVQPGGVRDDRTVVIDPAYRPGPIAGLTLRQQGDTATIQSTVFTAVLHTNATLTVSDHAGNVLLTVTDIFRNAAAQGLELDRTDSDPVYGIAGTDRNVEGTMTRTGDVPVAAGVQGNGGAPMFFTRRYAVLVDSTAGTFSIHGPRIAFHHGTRRELEAFLLVGDPMHTQAGVADLAGHAPMAPRWTMGFINSQWGLDEKELRTIVQRYREEHLPLDGFVMDFDWKAWGEDNYGEWRWNSTSGAGAVAPDKFPDGASGKLAADLLDKGVHLAGILKPRIVLYKVGTKDLDEAASYAEEHHLWYPNEPETFDYFSKRPSRDINFNLPEAREWYWQHLQPSFDAGITAWWNDEADRTDLPDKSEFRFDSLQFLNMGRALYDGQRAHSDKRVWSINRNYFMGSLRYGYAEWSGDILTGTKIMQQQPLRMLASMNIGEPHWSMDTGGFHGHPSNEVYARWMEFAAFVPIFRVHGDKNEKRQPWVYGPIAEAAAAHAMQLRYELMPYLYSAERNLHETGIGIVRPLGWMYPDDATAAQQTAEWMFGDALLVAPVLDEQPTKSIYLPAGTWWDYASGKKWDGLQAIDWQVDVNHWSDIPLFVRAGSIVATAPAGDDTDTMKPAEVTLDIFPSGDKASFNYYEDDGATYAYEKGKYFLQRITAVAHDARTAVELALPAGSFQPGVQTYRLRVHGVSAASVRLNGVALRRKDDAEREGRVRPSWHAASDKYGPVTEVTVAAGRVARIDVR